MGLSSSKSIEACLGPSRWGDASGALAVKSDAMASSTLALTSAPITLDLLGGGVPGGVVVSDMEPRTR